jgi:hypothetical protein
VGRALPGGERRSRQLSSARGRLTARAGSVGAVRLRSCDHAEPGQNTRIARRPGVALTARLLLRQECAGQNQQGKLLVGPELPGDLIEIEGSLVTDK